jgi:hypothetical protein
LVVAAAKEERSKKNPLWLTTDDLQAHLLKVSFFPLRKKGRENQHLLV